MIIKLTKDNFNFRFKDKEGTELKEFGSTHIKDNMIYVPQVEAYIDLNSIK